MVNDVSEDVDSLFFSFLRETNQRSFARHLIENNGCRAPDPKPGYEIWLVSRALKQDEKINELLDLGGKDDDH